MQREKKSLHIEVNIKLQRSYIFVSFHDKDLLYYYIIIYQCSGS